MTWMNEFGKEYKPPSEVEAAVAEGLLEDASWHHDACPSFVTTDERAKYVLWVDHSDQDRREYPHGRRFLVQHNQSADDPAGGYRPLYEGDDVNEALAKVRELMEKEKAK
jgi:hypothetical protein